MRIAILGGSFNPVHSGHLALADAVLSSLDYDRVILVPAHISPFKPDACAENPSDRLTMLAASIAGDPRLVIDDCELRREGVSYTADTIADIRRRYLPDGKIGLVIGDDLAQSFMEWRRVEEILCNVEIIMANRLPESTGGPLGFDYTPLNNDIFPVSSSMVRERIAAGKNWRYLVPAPVRFIIEDYGLYGIKPSGEKEADPLPKGSAAIKQPQKLKLSFIAYMEHEVRSLVSPRRFIHSRNTGVLCHDLCAHYGLDPMKGYLAGVVHDICKSFSAEKQIALAEQDGNPISEMERANAPALLHSRAGAVLLKERYGIIDKDILEAVRCHTTGAENMGDLAKIVFLTDKTEPSRLEVKPFLREACVHPSETLDNLFVLVVEETVNFLHIKGKDISRDTLNLLLSLKDRER